MTHDIIILLTWKYSYMKQRIFI